MTIGNEVLVIKSSDRTLGSSAGLYTIQLPKTYLNVTSIALVSAEIPYSFGNIVQSLTTSLSFTQASIPQTTVYTLPVGTYTITDIQAHLKAWLLTNFATLGVTDVAFSSISGKLTILWSANTDLSVFTTVSQGLGSVLGIAKGFVTTGTNTLTFPNVANLQPMSSLLMKINNLPTNVLTTDNQCGTFRIQLSSPPSSILMINNSANINNTIVFNTPILSINTLSIQMVHSDNTQVDFRGCDYSISLKITCST